MGLKLTPIQQSIISHLTKSNVPPALAILQKSRAPDVMTVKKGSICAFLGKTDCWFTEIIQPSRGKGYTIIGAGGGDTLQIPGLFGDHVAGPTVQFCSFTLWSLPFQLSNQVPPKAPSFDCQEGHKLFMAKGYQPLHNLEGQCAPTTFETITGLKPLDSKA